jgi:4,5-DOPA dioxygenase extradiol
MTGASRMPVLFVGHGSPMNLIERNAWSRGFESLSAYSPEPRAVLAISAHWYVDGSFVTGDAAPRTIHDFSGFPRALYEIDYPAPGDAALAGRICDQLGADRVHTSLDWGLDHGTWSVLRWMFPQADIPVVQLSIDRRLPPAAHVELGAALSPLRDDSVFILASGNLTHTLRDAFMRMKSGRMDTPDWAQRFDEAAASAIAARDTEGLLALWPASADGGLAHPTPDHWLPILYAHGASTADDAIQCPIEGFDLGSLSMRSIVYGPRAESDRTKSELPQG